MKQYLRERHERERNSVLTGIILTLTVHVCAALLVSFNGIKYLYPPPAENTFLTAIIARGFEKKLRVRGDSFFDNKAISWHGNCPPRLYSAR